MCSKTFATKLSLIMLILSSIISVHAQDSVWVIERGPHYQITKRESTVTDLTGRTKTVERYITELETGMNYWDGQFWQPAEEKIEIVEGVAIASKGLHQVRFAPNANVNSAITVTLPDGKQFKAHVIGLSYYDAKSGQSVLLGKLKSSQGFVVGQKQVLYADAFEGIEADLRYTYTKAAIEQDVILRQRPAAPEQFGMDSATTRLEVLTEFDELPDFKRVQKVVTRELNPVKRQNMVEPDVIDEKIDFGSMQLGVGKTFPVGSDPDSGPSTSKRLFRTEEGRQFLAESVPWNGIEPKIRGLQAAKVDLKKLNRPVNGRNSLLAAKEVPERIKAGRMLYAMQLPDRPGYVIDWTSASSATNYTFETSKSYRVSGTVNLSGTTTFEEGTSIKFTTGTTGELVIMGPLVSKGVPYAPVVFTGDRDCSVGELITGSAIGTNYFGKTGLRIQEGPADLGYMRFTHLREAVRFDSAAGSGHVIKHAQFARCLSGIIADGSDFSVRNALFAQVKTNFVDGGSGATGRCENVTIDGADTLYLGTISLLCTNSLLVAVTNFGSPVLEYSETNSASSNVFTTVGDGLHYLPTNSAYRDAGTTNINAELLADLTKRTTEAPLLWTNSISTQTVFAPLVALDADGGPDLGYHYEPIDYVTMGLTVSSTLTLTNGVVCAGLTNSTFNVGGQLVSVGSPLYPNLILPANQVQERTNGAYNVFLNIQVFGGGATVDLNFTKSRFELARPDSHHTQGDYHETSVFKAVNSEFIGAKMYVDLPITLAFTNCLWDRVITVFDPDEGAFPLQIHNATFNRGEVYFYAAGNWVVRNSLINVGYYYKSGVLFSSNNAYASGLSPFSVSSGNDLTNQVFNFQMGPLGNYYLPTNSALINAGSTSATNVGLYHFTTQTNNVKETNSVVDIGYHYVAVDANGLPIDTDGDGRPDYYEDANGNGLVDNGEESFLVPDFDRDGVPDWQDGDPNNPNIGVLSISVDSPTNGEIIQ